MTEELTEISLDDRSDEVFVMKHDGYWSLHSEAGEELYDEPTIYYDEQDMMELYQILDDHFSDKERQFEGEDGTTGPYPHGEPGPLFRLAKWIKNI